MSDHPLARLGGRAELQAHVDAARDPAAVPARVVAVDRGRVLADAGAGPWSAPLAGRLRRDGAPPATGDFVVGVPGGPVRAILPRRGVIARRGDRGRVQVLAANVDLALLATSPNRDLNPRRLARFLAITARGDVAAVVLLTKADLTGDADAVAADLTHALDGVPAIAVSAHTGRGLDVVRALLAPRRTAVLLGSSGVGKSTLLNALLGEARQATREIRAGDDRGRHATVRRELVPLPGARCSSTPRGCARSRRSRTTTSRCRSSIRRRRAGSGTSGHGRCTATTTARCARGGETARRASAGRADDERRPRDGASSSRAAAVASPCVLPHREYARERIAQHAARVALRIHANRLDVGGLEIAGPVGRIGHDEAQHLDYRPAIPGEPLGPLFATYWLRGVAQVPQDWAGARVDLLVDTGSESTLWLDGRPVQGLNSGPAQLRPDAILVPRATGGDRVAFELEIACNDPFGFGPTGGGAAMAFALRRCELARFDADAWDLFHDLEVLRELELEPDLDAAWAGRLLAELHAFTLDGDRERLARLRERAATSAHRMSAVGHAHLDTAWLWPLEETWRKLVRTTTTQLRLLDAYPEHVFAHSQAQHYAWLAERAPDLYARLRDAVAAGRWIPVGGTWVEPDCNLPSGESLARQFLYGQRLFERELGRRCTEFWQPDVFGYTAQLPQLMRLAGISRFLTQKLSWNRFTTPEHHTFTWQGLDGSEVVTHFPPADTYNAEATVHELRRAATAYKDHPRSAHSLLVFGHGDGGGGPTPGMLERLRRARDLAGLPPTEIRAPEAFFDDLEADARDLRTVVGELYFEYHRGTYTSQAALKRGNRRAEQALHDAELLDALLAGAPAHDELAPLWRTLLLNQFHDVLPGTSITEVNARARADLDGVVAGADAVARRALATDGEPVPVSTRGAARVQVATAPDGTLVAVGVPGIGAGRVVDAGDEATAERRDDGAVVLANAHLLAVVGPDGALWSVVHRATGRDALAAPGNRLELYEDDPVAYDAWDVDPVHLETRRDCPPAPGIAAVREHPLRVEAVVERVVGERSRLRQTYRLDAGARRLEVHTEIDWQEEHRFLKGGFPLAVHASEATFEVAFGAVRRPTHRSTRADLARYEVPGHRWADLSEHGFGVALLTDSTYGYSADGGTLRLSLLRAPRLPDPEADRGRHAFAYAVMPHAGTWQDAGVVAEAAAFGAPLRWGAAPDGAWAAVEEAPGLVLDSVKRAEDGDALVLRLYEAHGGRGVARVRLARPVAAAQRANLLEEPLEPAELRGGAIVVPFRPWEIVTLVVQAAP